MNECLNLTAFDASLQRVCFVLALVCMTFVKHGETQTISEEVIQEIRDNED